MFSAHVGSFHPNLLSNGVFLKVPFDIYWGRPELKSDTAGLKVMLGW